MQPADPSVRLTLVVCTRDRAAQLRRCLKSIAAIRAADPWELLVVDNGSADATARIIAEHARGSSIPVRAVYEPRPGTGWARNRGWREARGQIVAFTDDDCYPDREFVSQVLAIFRDHPTLGFVGGRIALYDPTDLPITIQENPDRIGLRPRKFIPAGLIQSANLAVRRLALEAVGGFDERLGAGTDFPCEDVDLVARMSARGWEGAYDPAPLVYHHHGRRTAQEASHLMRQYDRGRGAYYLKCLLNPALTLSTARHWMRSMLGQPLGTTLREWRAAIELLARR